MAARPGCTTVIARRHRLVNLNRRRPWVLVLVPGPPAPAPSRLDFGPFMFDLIPLDPLLDLLIFSIPLDRSLFSPCARASDGNLFFAHCLPHCRSLQSRYLPARLTPAAAAS